MASALKNRLRKSNRHIEDKKKFICSVEDYDRTYDTPMLIFKMIGIRLNRKDSDLAKRCWNIYYWFEFYNILAATILEVLHMILTKKGRNLEDNIQIFIMVPCAGYAILALTNCYKIVSHREIFEGLVNDLRDMYPRGQVPKEEYRVITKANTLLSYVVRGYYYSNALLLIAYMIRPYIAALKRYLGYDQPKEMLLLYYFPFDAYKSVVFEVITVVQTYQGTVAVLSLQCGVMMFCILLSHIAVQFDLLSLRVQKMVPVPIDHQLPPSYPLSNYGMNNFNSVFNDDEMDKRIRQDLDDIIFRHRTLIRLAGVVESLMSLPLLLIFANSTIIICFCGFCSVIVEKASEVVYKTFLVTALLQIWLVCSYGQKLVDSSQGFSEALYKSGWYNTSKRNCRTIFIMMHRFNFCLILLGQRNIRATIDICLDVHSCSHAFFCGSQKAVRVTTYMFQTILCLASYTTVIKTSWSYLSLLLNVYKEK